MFSVSRSLRKQPTFRDAASGFYKKWRLSDEIPYWWRVLTQIWVVVLIGCNLFHPIRCTTQIWVVTRHQYGLSAFVSQTSFRGETRGSVARCRVFSQTMFLVMFGEINTHQDTLTVKTRRCNNWKVPGKNPWDVFVSHSRLLPLSKQFLSGYPQRTEYEHPLTIT